MTLNSSEYNQATYDAMQNFLLWTATDDIIFNWLWLQNENISTSFKNDDNLPNIDLNKFQNPVIDWGWVLKRRYTEKQITLKWFLKSTDDQELNNLIDLFKQKTSCVEWYLDIKVNWYYRRTKATVVSNNLFAREHYNINVVPFEITFATLEPFFYNKQDETITETGITGDYAIEFNYNWTAPSQPRVYFIFWAGTVDTDTMTFKLNWKQLTVNEAVEDWDILLYDSITKSVTINWVEVDYVWAFPQIQYGNNLFEFEVNWTPNYDITVLYATNFL